MGGGLLLMNQSTRRTAPHRCWNRAAPLRAFAGERRGHTKEAPVKQALLPVFVLAFLLTGCATDPYGRSSVESRATLGVLVGGALGALVGRAAGVNPVAGAAAGMVAGGAAGVLIKGPVVNGRQYYRDSRGYCYYVDAAGRPTYDPLVTC
jgi:p-aminobenzoyl-glutamate transporter AbgT